MVQFQADLRVWLTIMLVALATIGAATAATMIENAASTCGNLVGPSDSVRIDSATLQASSQLAVSERAPTPAARITPANPVFCKVLGHIDPTDPKAPPIKFEVNLPVEWNGRSLQYGGGGVNGGLVTGLDLPPAPPLAKPSPPPRGFPPSTAHFRYESKTGEPPPTFSP